MEQALIQTLTTQWPSVAILSFWWYFLVKYFMSQIDKKDAIYKEEMAKKDTQNQINLDRFIGLVEKTNDVIGKFWTALDWLHPKLNEMHEDIKKIRDKS